MVSQRGIKANPEKVQAIINMASPKTVKEVQKLTERIAAINRFVSRATDKCLPFFKTLKQAFVWTDKCEAAFKKLKRYLSNPLLLSPSQETAPCLLCQPSFSKGKIRLPKNRKNRVRLDRGLTQVKAVFPGKSHPSDDGPTHQKIDEQIRSGRKNGSMGHQTQPV